MSKTCQYDKCNNPQFGGGYCRNHQYLRTDKKQKPLSTKKSIRKVSKNQRTKLADKSKLTAKDRLLWAEIWEEREHIDFETGQPICGEALTLYFHHVLPKRPKHLGGYPEYRYEKWNIVLVSWETHTKAEADLDLVPKIKEYTQRLKTLHDEQRLSNRRVSYIPDLV
jgi:hypothetical protein